MERLKQFFDKVANDNDLKVSNNKLTQTVRNKLKDEFTETLLTILIEQFADDDNVLIERIKGAVGIGINNEKVGLIPIELKATFKNLDEDILDLADEYKLILQQRAERKAKAEKTKQNKIEAQEMAKARKG